jgi:hypothetical protein
MPIFPAEFPPERGGRRAYLSRVRHASRPRKGSGIRPSARAKFRWVSFGREAKLFTRANACAPRLSEWQGMVRDCTSAISDSDDLLPPPGIWYYDQGYMHMVIPLSDCARFPAFIVSCRISSLIGKDGLLTKNLQSVAQQGSHLPGICGCMYAHLKGCTPIQLVSPQRKYPNSKQIPRVTAFCGDRRAVTQNVTHKLKTVGPQSDGLVLGLVSSFKDTKLVLAFSPFFSACSPQAEQALNQPIEVKVELQEKNKFIIRESASESDME